MAKNGIVAKSPAESIDLARLLKLRLVIARFGEMDCAGWWNTRGVLGQLGKKVFQRGFPKTHCHRANENQPPMGGSKPATLR
jgi:hypothetical protein